MRRRDVLVLAILIAAVVLLIWNGSEFFQQLTQCAERPWARGLKIACIALTLNVALILFGWRRYVDLQHETELRMEGEARAALIASTDGMTGLLNRKGFADRGEELRCQRRPTGQQLVILSLQIHRFKAINDRHGYEVGDRMLRMIAVGAGTRSAGPRRSGRAAEPATNSRSRSRCAERRARRGRAAGRTTAARDHPADGGRRADGPGRRLCRNCRVPIRDEGADPGPAAPRRHRAGSRQVEPLGTAGLVRRGHGAGADRPQRDRAGHPLRPRARPVRSLLRAAGRPADRRDHRLRSAGALGSSAERDDRARPFHPGRRGAWADRPAVGAGHPRRPGRGGRLGSVDQDCRSTSRRRSWPTAGWRSGSSGCWPRPASRPSGWWSKSPKARCSPTSTWPGRSSPASRTRASAWRSTISAPASRRSPTCARCRST